MNPFNGYYMIEERKNWELTLGISSVCCGIFGLFSSFPGYYFFHYRNLQERSVREFLHSDLPKKDQECLLRGHVECSSPIDVSTT